MIRHATTYDIDRILSIVRDAQLSLRALGIDQWQDGYPSRDIIEQDIASGIGHVLCNENNEAIGYAAIVLSGEAAYLQIKDSAWHTPQEYVVVHRLCVANDARRKGVAIELMRHASKVARESGIFAFRIDTHRGNVRMLTMLEKLDFAYVGIIHYDSGERMAFDLNLRTSKTL